MKSLDAVLWKIKIPRRRAAVVAAWNPVMPQELSPNRATTLFQCARVNGLALRRDADILLILGRIFLSKSGACH
jgi:hypothetical protein